MVTHKQHHDHHAVPVRALAMVFLFTRTSFGMHFGVLGSGKAPNVCFSLISDLTVLGHIRSTDDDGGFMALSECVARMEALGYTALSSIIWRQRYFSPPEKNELVRFFIEAGCR